MITTDKIKIKRLAIVGPRTPHFQMVADIFSKDFRVEITSNKKKLYDYELHKKTQSLSVAVVNIVVPKQDTKLIVTITAGTKKLQRTVINNPVLRYALKFSDTAKEFLNKSEYKKLDSVRAYSHWIKKNEICDNEKIDDGPLISVLVPVYNTQEKFLRKCIESVLAQTYQNFELCLADDCSTNPNVKKILDTYAKKDPRVKVVYRQKNGNISEATNSALAIAKGEYVALLDNDDEITENALAENVKAIKNSKGKADFIYSDEDKLDRNGNRCYPHFKPDWSPDTLLSINYITHFTVIRKSIVEKIGGFRTKYNGAQDYDLFLRATENLDSKKILHIPKILYHWRISDTSTAMDIGTKTYAVEAGRRALEDTLKRRGIKGKVEVCLNTTVYSIDYETNPKDLVSIIIPTKDNPEVLKRCIDSIKKYTKEKYELIIVNNNSEKPESFAYYKKLEQQGAKVLTINEPFNYSMLNNRAAKKAKGRFLLFLNDDTEATESGWLKSMMGFASQKHIAAVGAKLLYPGREYIQHAGVVVGGSCGVANHIFLKKESGYLAPFARLTVPYNYSAVTGACLMIEKLKFNRIGGFEEKLAVAFNDIDLCLKALRSGYFNVFLPQVIFIHHESLSRGLDNTDPAKIKRFNEENIRMQKKWGEVLSSDPFFSKNYNRENISDLYFS